MLELDVRVGAALLPEEALLLEPVLAGAGAGVEEAGADMLGEEPVSVLFERRLEPESAGTLGEEAEVDAEPDGVTIELILSMVRCETPAFERSETLE